MQSNGVRFHNSISIQRRLPLVLPGCSPGAAKRLRGWLSFYEGTDIQGELDRIEKLEWRSQSID